MHLSLQTGLAFDKNLSAISSKGYSLGITNLRFDMGKTVEIAASEVISLTSFGESGGARHALSLPAQYLSRADNDQRCSSAEECSDP